MLRLALFTGVALFAAVTPAFALFCQDHRGGINFSFGVSVGEEFTERDRNQFDLMRLRQMGVETSRVERWSGCIRAYVRKPEGGEEMQFFDPNTYRRVQ